MRILHMIKKESTEAGIMYLTQVTYKSLRSLLLCGL